MRIKNKHGSVHHNTTIEAEQLGNGKQHVSRFRDDATHIVPILDPRAVVSFTRHGLLVWLERQTGKGGSLRSTPLCLASSRSEEHTSELQSRPHLVCRLLLEKKK